MVNEVEEEVEEEEGATAVEVMVETGTLMRRSTSTFGASTVMGSLRVAADGFCCCCCCCSGDKSV